MSASSALQKAIIDTLTADPDVASIVSDRVFDVPPAGAPKPYVSLGPSSFYTGRRDGKRVRFETVQIDTWTGDEERRQPCKGLVDAVTDALDGNRLSLEDPYACGRADLILARVFDDPDGITKHGALQFEYEVSG